jgi:rhamnosyl/mannosyltransferase
VDSVVHVYKDQPPVRGGIEGHVALLGRLLAERGVDVEVLCSRRRGTARADRSSGVLVRRCWSPLTLASTPLPPGLPWRLGRSGAKLVHLHYPWPPGEVAALLGRRGRPLVVTVHCEVIRYPALARLLDPLTRRVLSSASCIVVSSSVMAEVPLLVEHRARVRVIPYGVDLRRFRPDASVPDPLPAVRRPRIVFVGRLRYYKGLPVLAAALGRLPGAQLVVIGDGPERHDFERALRAHGCRERAHLLGAVGEERLLQILQTSDAAVLASSSRAETFGLSIAEAQACGVPAVTTEVGTGTAQTVSQGASGRVVAADDPVSLAEALAWCLDPARSAERRHAARRHAETALCGRRMAREVHEVYGEVAASSG